MYVMDIVIMRIEEKYNAIKYKVNWWNNKLITVIFVQSHVILHNCTNIQIYNKSKLFNLHKKNSILNLTSYWLYIRSKFNISAWY